MLFFKIKLICLPAACPIANLNHLLILASAHHSLSPFTDALATHSLQQVISTNFTHLNVVIVIKSTNAYEYRVERDQYDIFEADAYTVSHKSQYTPHIFVNILYIFSWDKEMKLCYSVK